MNFGTGIYLRARNEATHHQTLLDDNVGKKYMLKHAKHRQTRGLAGSWHNELELHLPIVFNIIGQCAS